MGRKYDLVILEPVGSDVGLRTVEHICQFLRRDLRWAVAGADTGQLSACVEELKSASEKGSRSLPASEVCSGTKEELYALAEQTKVIINICDMSDGKGEMVVEACVNNGTHYLDSFSDVYWLGGIIRKYHDLAKENRVIILSHTGAASTPQDLVTLCAVSKLKDKLNLQTREVVCSVNSPSSNPSRPPSSTSHTSALSRCSRHAQLNPWFLSPLSERIPKLDTSLNRLGLRRELTLGILSPSYSAATQQTRALLHRGWALQDGGRLYGDEFYYNEYTEVPRLCENVKRRMGLGWMKKMCSRNSCEEEEERVGGSDNRASHVCVRAIAIADQEGPFPDRALSELNYSGTPAQLSAAFLAQAAATILYSRGLITRVDGGGILTPAVLGMDYVDRLEKVGVEISGELV